MSGVPLNTALTRIIACGSVDDGKSTLIGRLLIETGSVPLDELAALKQASLKHGTRGAELDYALLLDGLEAEREQGITIDVSWRHLRFGAQRFLIADCPGHVQYTRNMASGAAQADHAIVLVDASKGLLPQTYKHLQILALLGVPGVVLAINKMDRVNFQKSVFQSMTDAFNARAADFGLAQVQAIPMAAALGENVTQRSSQMPWYEGKTLLDALSDAAQSAVEKNAAMTAAFCLPVQSILRDRQNRRWITGSVAQGQLRVGGSLRIEPAGNLAQVAEIYQAGIPAELAASRQPVAIRLQEDVDVGRGAVLVAPDLALEKSDQLAVDLLWFDQQPMRPGRRYRIQFDSEVIVGQFSEIKYIDDAQSQQHLAAKHVNANEIARAILQLDQPVLFLSYDVLRQMGSFMVVDLDTHATAGAGMVRFGLRRADNVHWQKLDVNQAARERLKRQTAKCVWLTGLSGAGKSTIANLAEKLLHAKGLHTYLLDGDNLRHGLNRDLGFSIEDRIENQRRVSEVARLMVDAGLIVMVSLISPFRADRLAARQRFAEGEFIEVFVDTPLATAEKRDVKGLYAKARRGLLPAFTGIDSPYEAPLTPELVLHTEMHSADELAALLVEKVLLHPLGH